jgi:hypothetical protein
VLWCAWFVRPRDWRRLVAPLAIAVAVVIAIAPLLYGYQVRQDVYGLTRTYDEVRFFSADLTGLARIFHRMTLWKGVLPDTYEEGAIFPGFTIAALAMLALVAAIRARGASLSGLPGKPEGFAPRASVLFYFCGALFMWLIALGPQPAWNGTPIAYGPYWLLMKLPGISAIRVPPRAWLLAALCLAVLAAFGVKALAERTPPRYSRIVTLLLGLLVVAEGWFYEVTVAAPTPGIERGIPAGALVLDAPLESQFWNAIPQYRAVIGGYRTISGYSGYEPPFYEPFRHAFADRDPEALDQYRRREDLYVILRPTERPERVDWVRTQPGARKLFDYQGAVVYVLPRREIP